MNRYCLRLIIRKIYIIIRIAFDNTARNSRNQANGAEHILRMECVKNCPDNTIFIKENR